MNTLEALRIGLSVFLHWEFWVTLLLYLFIANSAIIFYKFQPLISLFLFIITESIALIVFLLILYPIIFNISDNAAWKLPYYLIIYDTTNFILLLVLSIFVSFAIQYLPIIGSLTTIQTIARGLVVFFYIIDNLNHIYPMYVKPMDIIPIIPDIYTIIMIAIIGLLSIYVFYMLGISIVTFIDSLIEKSVSQYSGNAANMLTTLVYQAFLSAAGLTPLLIYGAWLGTVIKY